MGLNSSGTNCGNEEKMFTFICKKLLRPNPRFPDASPPRLLQPHIGRNTPPAAGHYFSTESENEDGAKGHLCPKSSYVVVGSAADKVEVTKTLFKDYGFTDTQISKLYIKRPNIFNCIDPDKTLMPKLEFFRGTIGFSNTDLPRLICSNPSVLSSSLQNQILPVYNFLKDSLLSDDDVSDDEIVLKTLKRNHRILTYSLENTIGPNISALRQAGMLQKQISYLMRWAPAVLGSMSLEEYIKKAAEMGFQPNTLSFVEAIRMFNQMSKSTWDKKVEAYRKCGWSDEETLKAFRLNPQIMSFSEGKIEKCMDFVVNKMGWQPGYLARNPGLLDYSLEKRIVPRCTFVKYLQAKGLLTKNVSLRGIVKPKEKDFRDKFVNKYKIDVPDLLDIYLGKLGSNVCVRENEAVTEVYPICVKE